MIEFFKLDTSGLPKKKKLIRLFVILNFSVLIGLALFMLVFTVINVLSGPIDLGYGTALAIWPLMLYCALFAVTIAFVELYTGISVFKGSRPAAVFMILCLFICPIGIFGTVAAIIGLIKTKDEEEQSRYYPPLLRKVGGDNGR